MAIAYEQRAVQGSDRSLGIVDCDVHNALRSPADLRRYLPQRWQGYHDLAGAGVGLSVGAPPRTSVFRVDSFPPEGPPGSDVDVMREQLLDRFGVSNAVVHPIIDALRNLQYGDLGLALARAMNDWMTEEWIEADERIFGAVTIPIEDGNLAAAEIARVAADPRFVKVLMTSLTREPLGHSKYWPIYEAAVAHGLPVGVHVAGFSGVQSSAGWGSYFVEKHTNYVLAYSAQVTSLVYSGVFDHFPQLQFVFEEGGLAWLPPLMWRLDRTWREMREEAAHLEIAPSEIIRRHVWLATQPLDEPNKHEYLGQVLAQLGMDDRVVFSSDYPHHDFDDPRRVLPASVIGESMRERILTTNARALFRFPTSGATAAP